MVVFIVANLLIMQGKYFIKTLVMKDTILNHPYAQVICTNKSELLYVLQYAKDEGKKVAEFMWDVDKFPFHLFLEGNIVGWTDSTDRVGDKFSFKDFINAVH